MGGGGGWGGLLKKTDLPGEAQGSQIDLYIQETDTKQKENWPQWDSPFELLILYQWYAFWRKQGLRN